MHMHLSYEYIWKLADWMELFGMFIGVCLSYSSPWLICLTLPYKGCKQKVNN